MTKPTPLLKARQALGESQNDFAKRLGVDQSSLSRLERGVREPSGSLSLLIERVLAEVQGAAE